MSAIPSASCGFPREGRVRRGKAFVLAYLALALMVSSQLSFSVQSPTAAFIETHSEDQSSLQDYWHAAVSFRKIGYAAHLLSPMTGFASITSDNLTEFVSVLLITPRDSASFGNDIDTLVEFVEEGNGIIITGQSASSDFEGWARSAVNEMTSLFGIEFQRDLVCDPEAPFLSDARYPHWPVISRFEEHPATAGLDRVSYHSGCSLKVFGNATAVAWTSEKAWSDLDDDHVLDDGEKVGEKIIAAVSEYGKGRIAFIGDNNLWSSRFLDCFDNNELLLSLLAWVSGRVEELDLKIEVMDVTPEVTTDEDGNYSTEVSVAIWNQGTIPAKNLTVYLNQGAVTLPDGNLTYDSVEPGQVVASELRLRFNQSNCRHVQLYAEYYDDDAKQVEILRTIRLEMNNTLNNIPIIFGNQTEIALGSPGGWGNYSAEEFEAWANETKEVVAARDLVWDSYNHTDVGSEVGTTHSVKTSHFNKNIVAIGDPDCNYVSASVSEKGELRIVGNDTAPQLFSPRLYDESGSMEEILSHTPRMVGNMSEWGYLSLLCAESFREKSDNRLAVGGFGRAGMETALEVFFGLLSGELSGYEAELSGSFALFRGLYEDGELVGLEFR